MFGLLCGHNTSDGLLVYSIGKFMLTEDMFTISLASDNSPSNMSSNNSRCASEYIFMIEKHTRRVIDPTQSPLSVTLIPPSSNHQSFCTCLFPVQSSIIDKSTQISCKAYTNVIMMSVMVISSLSLLLSFTTCIKKLYRKFRKFKYRCRSSNQMKNRRDHMKSIP